MKYSAELTGKIIRAEREKRNWSQPKLGEVVGITGKQISKYECGELIPPMDMMFKLCEVFGCELGYLLGEETYSEGTKLQTAIREHLKLTADSANAIRYIMGEEYGCINHGWKSEKYVRVFNELLSLREFAEFIEALVELDGNIAERENRLLKFNTKFGKEIADKAISLYKSHIDYAHCHDDTPLSTEVCEAIVELEMAIDESQELEYSIKVARYELNRAFECMIKELYPADSVII